MPHEWEEKMTVPPDVFGPTRREVLTAAGFLALTATGSGAPAALAQGRAVAQGTVYDQATSPRQGIADVMVSNGLDVAKTDAQGKWSLPVDDGDSVFVIKPTGWALPVDPATNLPRFAYVYAPSGSPDLSFRFAGVAPTGKLPDSI